MKSIFYPYARVSTHEQNKKGDLEKQIEKIQLFIKLHGAINQKIYSEVSPAGKQPKLKKLMKKINKGNSASKRFLIVTNLGRVFREKNLSYKVKKFLEKQKVKTICVEECMLNNIAQARFPNNEEIDKCIQRKKIINANTLKGKMSKIEKNQIAGHRMPFGFKGKFEIDIEKAKEVRMLFEKYLSLKSINKLTSWAEENDLIKTKSLGYMLRNKAYIGSHYYNKTTLRKSKPIVDESLFNKVQTQLNKNTKHKN